MVASGAKTASFFGVGKNGMGTLPASARPSSYVVLSLTIHNQNHLARVHVETNGDLAVQGGGNAREILLDGATFALL